MAVAITAACLLSVSLLHRCGVSARRRASRPHGAGKPVLVRSLPELYEVWLESGVHGQPLVHMGRYFHFVPLPATEAQRTATAGLPIETFDLVTYYETQLDRQNLLWLAVERGIARKIYHVLQPAELERRIKDIDPSTPGIRFEGLKILATEHGTRRVATDRLPELDEPAVVTVDASFLDSDAAATRALEQLSTLMPRIDLLVLCRSDDNPDVYPDERRRLDWLAKQLEAVPR